MRDNAVDFFFNYTVYNLTQAAHSSPLRSLSEHLQHIRTLLMTPLYDSRYSLLESCSMMKVKRQHVPPPQPLTVHDYMEEEKKKLYRNFFSMLSTLRLEKKWYPVSTNKGHDVWALLRKVSAVSLAFLRGSSGAKEMLPSLFPVGPPTSLQP